MEWFGSNLRKDEDGDVADAFFIADEEDETEAILSVRFFLPLLFPGSRILLNFPPAHCVRLD